MTSHSVWHTVYDASPSCSSSALREAAEGARGRVDDAVVERAETVVNAISIQVGRTGALTPVDERDAERAAVIVSALGRVDVGQGAVVQQGLCLAVEALPGTDAMLAGIAGLGALRPDAARGRGVFFKAPKPSQDRRIDLPTIGPETVARVAEAGLGGIAWEAGGVITLDLPDMRRRAGDAGLFLWAR